MSSAVNSEHPDRTESADPVQRVAVFCGARPGARPEHLALAGDVGRALARRGLPLVYGAGGVGVMGAVADAVLGGGGEVTGVIPRSLHDRERADRARGRIVVVDTMHQRKALMYRLAAGFAVLPGGLGTLDELLEVSTWNQLSLIRKPIVVINRGGFFTPLLRMLDHLVAEGFVAQAERRLIQSADEPEEALDRLGITAGSADARPGQPALRLGNGSGPLVPSSAYW